jgi:hypothetical protein
MAGKAAGAASGLPSFGGGRSQFKTPSPYPGVA